LDSSNIIAKPYYKLHDIVNGFLRFDDGLTYFILKTPISDVSFKIPRFKERTLPGV